MTVSFACIAPHGGELIPALAKRGEKGFVQTRKAMRILARTIALKRPNTIVIASPHNLRLFKRIAIVVAENSIGSLETSPDRKVGVRAACNVGMAWEILRETEAMGLPVVGANYGTFEGPSSNVAMDWGTLVPLWFVLHEQRVNARIVIVAPSREIPIQQNVKFGMGLANVLERKSSRRTVFVASADQAHTHSKSGPYGFSRAASKFDSLVVEAVKSGNLDLLTRLKPSFVDQAKPDSIWQIAILSGILSKVAMRPRFLSYEVPSYFGMICAGFERIR